VSDSRASLTDELDTPAPQLSLDPLVDCDFRTMNVVAVAPVEGSDRLLRMTVESGSDHRQVVAGIGPSDVETDLANARLVVLANLAPKTIAGHQSTGMILAAEVEGKPVAVTVTRDQEVGTLE